MGNVPYDLNAQSCRGRDRAAARNKFCRDNALMRRGESLIHRHGATTSAVVRKAGREAERNPGLPRPSPVDHDWRGPRGSQIASSHATQAFDLSLSFEGARKPPGVVLRILRSRPVKRSRCPARGLFCGFLGPCGPRPTACACRLAWGCFSDFARDPGVRKRHAGARCLGVVLRILFEPRLRAGGTAICPPWGCFSNFARARTPGRARSSDLARFAWGCFAKFCPRRSPRPEWRSLWSSAGPRAPRRARDHHCAAVRESLSAGHSSPQPSPCTPACWPIFPPTLPRRTG
jgi:hypothetical protein